MEFPVTFEHTTAAEAASRKVSKRGHMLVDEFGAPWFPDSSGQGHVQGGSGLGAALQTSTGAITILPMVDTGLSTNFCIQERITIPFTGWVRVRPWFFNTAAAVSTVPDCAVMGSTVFHPGAGDTAGTTAALWQPVPDDSGNGTAWSVQNPGPVVPAASGNAFVLTAANDGDVQMNTAGWLLVYVPQAVDAPLGFGNLFLRSHSPRLMSNWASRGYVYNIPGNYFRRGVEYANPGSVSWVASGQSAFNPGAGGGQNASIMSIAKLEIQSTKEVVNIWTVGDSIKQGMLTTGQANNFVTQYCSSRTTSKVAYLPSNLAIAGQPNICSLNIARAQLAKTITTGATNRALQSRPKYIFLDPYSNNDPYFHTNGGSGTGPLTQSQAILSYGQALDFADYAESLGVKIIWCTKIPYGNTLTPAQELVRTTANGWVRNSGKRYIDMDLAVSDQGLARGNGVATIQPQFTPDFVHLNDIANAAILARVPTDLGVL